MGVNRIPDASLTSLHLPGASQVSLTKSSSLEAKVLRWNYALDAGSINGEVRCLPWTCAGDQVPVSNPFPCYRELLFDAFFINVVQV